MPTRGQLNGRVELMLPHIRISGEAGQEKTISLSPEHVNNRAVPSNETKPT